MRATGMTRCVDQLGRCVIPKEVRERLQWSTHTPLEIFVDGNKVILQKYERGCTFCGEVTDYNFSFGGEEICEKCADKLREALRR